MHDYQRGLVDYILRNRRCGLYLPMGRGKTLIALSAVRKMMYSWDSKRVLIVAPKRVAKNVWLQEMAGWEHLHGMRLESGLIMGSVKDRTRALDKIKQGINVSVISRDAISWLSKQKIDVSFDTVIVDEAQSFKCYSSTRFKGLAKLTDRATNVILLSGTPMPQDAEDLWAQMYLIDKGHRLGKNITAFRRRYCHKLIFETHADYVLLEEHRDEVYRLVGEVTVSMDPPTDMPPIHHKKVGFRLFPDAAKIYAQAQKTGSVALPGHKKFVARTAAAKHALLRQLASGAYYPRQQLDGCAKTKTLVPIHWAKVGAFKRLINSEKYWPALVVYNYVFERDAIRLVLQETMYKSKYAEIDDEGAIDAWNAGELDYLIVHPDSAGEGLNLQSGGHTIIWYGITEKMGSYHQLNARLHRPGQTDPVLVLHLIAHGTIEEKKVMPKIIKKTKTQQHFMSTIKIEENP
ncbi:SNF2-related protein [Thiolapillus sp.]|uniref:SNF2-related protein n=1 Tax=Thiolapillus sp. TaxID=2017437 RepID=UPI003AF88051